MLSATCWISWINSALNSGLGKVFLTAWMVAVAVSDCRHGEVPNWLTLLPMAGFALLRLYLRTGLTFMLVAWAAILAVYYLHVWGGATAKFNMALFALYPQLDFLVLFCVVGLCGFGLLLVHRGGVDGWALPTAEALYLRGARADWVYALAGILATWIL